MMALWDAETEADLKEFRSHLGDVLVEETSETYKAKLKVRGMMSFLKVCSLLSVFLMVLLTWFSSNYRLSSLIATIIVALNGILVTIITSTNWSKKWVNHTRNGNLIEALMKEITDVLEIPAVFRKESPDSFADRIVASCNSISI